MIGTSQKTLQKALHKKINQDHFCEKCGGKTSYLVVAGIYTCNECGHSEKDNYGKLKEILEKCPGLSRIELASMLHISLRELNEYFENNLLVNPKNSLLT